MEIRTVLAVPWYLPALACAMLIACASDTQKAATSLSDSEGPGASEAADPNPLETVQPEVAQRIEPSLVITSPGLNEIIQLSRADVEEPVILAYIERSPIAFNPSADEVLYLHDIGISPRIIATLLNHGRQLQEKAGLANAGSTNEFALKEAAPQAETNSVPDANMIQEAPAPALQNQEQPSTAEATETYATTPSVTYASGAQEVSFEHFYDSLSPYGAWMELEGYGWCWQPTVSTLSATWRPYGDRGRWLFTDCGWYWQSDYSWGWAPFHYGRWFKHPRTGWLWHPDTVWGPAWVCWRRTPLLCGWAPLPPATPYDPMRGLLFAGAKAPPNCDFGLPPSHFAFVPFKHMVDRHPLAHFLAPDQMTRIFPQSVVAGHFFKGLRGMVMNDGIRPEHVTVFTRSELNRIEIRDVPPTAAPLMRPDHLAKVGKELVIYRPNLARPPITAPFPSTRGSQPPRPISNLARPGMHDSRPDSRHVPQLANVPGASSAHAPTPATHLPAARSSREMPAGLAPHTGRSGPAGLPSATLPPKLPDERRLPGSMTSTPLQPPRSAVGNAGYSGDPNRGVRQPFPGSPLSPVGAPTKQADQRRGSSYANPVAPPMASFNQRNPNGNENQFIASAPARSSAPPRSNFTPSATVAPATPPGVNAPPPGVRGEAGVPGHRPPVPLNPSFSPGRPAAMEPGRPINPGPRAFALPSPSLPAPRFNPPPASGSFSAPPRAPTPPPGPAMAPRPPAPSPPPPGSRPNPPGGNDPNRPRR